ncbi:hypothetical protein ACQP1W_52415 (plasmid) [Spirillospora sp. CA-255316]
MSSKDLPPPDASGTDPDEALRTRFSIGSGQPPPVAPAAPVPGPFSGTGLPGQPAAERAADRMPRKKATRPDPKGMRRASYYISQEAADALDAAVASVVETLGGDVPKHVALSALIVAGAERAAEVATQLGQARTAALAERLNALRTEAGES